MSPDAINELVLDGPVGLRWVRPLCRYPNSIVTSDIRSFLYTPKMVLFFLGYSKARLMHLFLRTLLSSFSDIAESGLNQSPF